VISDVNGGKQLLMQYAKNKARQYIRSYTGTNDGIAAKRQLSGSKRSQPGVGGRVLKIRNIATGLQFTGRNGTALRGNGSIDTKATYSPSRRSYAAGRSAGFVTSRKFKQNRSSVLGVNFTGEFGGTASNVDMIVIGHSSGPSTAVYRMVWYAIIKKLLKLADYDVLDTTVTVPSGTYGGAIVLTWKRSAGDSTQLELFTVGSGLTCESVDDIVEYLVNTGRAWNSNSSSDVSSIEMLTIAYVPKTTAEADEVGTMQESRIRLDETSITVSCKSTFKMQNRTENHTGEDQSALDNVPLYGKSYQGYGSGAYWIDGDYASESFVADRDHGLIKTTRPSNMKEPPKPSEFKGIVKAGKIRIEPGSIKTSVLNSSASHMLSTWIKMLVPGLFITKAKSSFGSYRFFCIEKILDPDHVASILCAFEHNLAMTSSVKTIRKNGTCAVYTSAYNL